MSSVAVKDRPQSPLLTFFRPKKHLQKLSPSSEPVGADSPNSPMTPSTPSAPHCPAQAASHSSEDPCSCRQFLSHRYATESVWSGANPEDVPKLSLGPLVPGVFAAFTGPDSGLQMIHELKKERGETVGSSIAGCSDWRMQNKRAFGTSISLYERHPFSKKMAGEPIADSFGVLAATNHACLAIADGVNWGKKARLASRCAIYGAVSYVQKKIFAATSSQSSASSNSEACSSGSVSDTRAALQILLEAFSVAQSTILRYEGGLTTLAVAVVLPLADDPLASGAQFCVCVVNLGDSLVYLLSKHHGLREVSVGSHDVEMARNIRDAGGALGPVYNGTDPELNNLTCSVTLADPGDILFLTSDGISDNFDPVVTKIALPSCPAFNGHQIPAADDCEDSFGPLLLTPPERHHYAMKAMEKVLHEYELETQTEPCAKSLCETLANTAYNCSAEKRSALEDPALYGPNDRRQSAEERSARHAMLSEKLATCPGKLDHATIVAYEIGVFHRNGKRPCDNTTHKNCDSSKKDSFNDDYERQTFSLPSTPNPIRNLFRKKSAL